MREAEKKLEISARNGCVAAFEELIAPHQSRIYNLMLKTCGNEYEASQLAQEVFVRAFEELSQNRGERGFSASIYAIATQISRNTNFLDRLPQIL